MPYFQALHISFFNNSNNTWRQVQIMKLFITQFHLISYYFQSQVSIVWLPLSPNLVYSISSHSHTKLNTPASVKTLRKHTHTFVSQVTFSDNKVKYDYVVCINRNSFHLHFLILQSKLLTTPSKYLISALPFRFSNTEVTSLMLRFCFCKSSDEVLPHSFLSFGMQRSAKKAANPPTHYSNILWRKEIKNIISLLSKE